ncbi:hypothetical protein JM93_00413 [Roseibium hamelinense]|uniref:Uncharacterized protein n=1 Tax=Roseibium hamelinense TaxID=150831 RepID=A0A562TGX0_9HYPH|nr:hypothetical protein JM93_00413 [Roseibium hamelinense]
MISADPSSGKPVSWGTVSGFLAGCGCRLRFEFCLRAARCVLFSWRFSDARAAAGLTGLF